MNIYGKLTIGLVVVGTAAEIGRRVYNRFVIKKDQRPHVASSWEVSTSPDFNNENIVADTTKAEEAGFTFTQDEIVEAAERLGENPPELKIVPIED